MTGDDEGGAPISEGMALGSMDAEQLITIPCADGTEMQCKLVDVVDGVLPDNKTLAILMEVSSDDADSVDLILMQFIEVDDVSFDLGVLDEDDYLLAEMHAKLWLEELVQEPFTIMSGGPDVGEA
jgi:hypothetical protein